MTMQLAITSLAVALVMIVVFWSWVYYVASHGLGIWVRPSMGIKLANVAIVVAMLVGAGLYLRHYWILHGVNNLKERQNSLLMTGVPVLVWLVFFMFWLERAGKRHGWTSCERNTGPKSGSS